MFKPPWMFTHDEEVLEVVEAAVFESYFAVRDIWSPGRIQQMRLAWTGSGDSLVLCLVNMTIIVNRLNVALTGDLHNLISRYVVFYGGIFRTYIVLLFISCARHFLFRRSFFLFYYLVRTTFLFCMSFFLFYYLVRTTFFSIILLYIIKGAPYTRK